MRLKITSPVRLSLFGGGTDLPVYYEKYGGIVINMAINIYQTIELSDESNVYSYFEGANPKFYQAFFDEFDYKPRSMKLFFDASIESGMGSSASAAVALVKGISTLKGASMTNREVAEKAWDIEVNKLGLYGGKQDQYAASMGGMSTIWFNSTKGVFIYSLDKGKASRIQKSILLFYTGNNRKDTKIQEELKELSYEQEQALHNIKSIARRVRKSVEEARIRDIGEALDESWEAKKKSNHRVTTGRVDEIYDEAIKQGAMGGKLMGSGGGGYMFFVAEPRFHAYIVKALTDMGCGWIDFDIDYNGVMKRYL